MSSDFHGFPSVPRALSGQGMGGILTLENTGRGREWRSDMRGANSSGQMAQPETSSSVILMLHAEGEILVDSSKYLLKPVVTGDVSVSGGKIRMSAGSSFTFVHGGGGFLVTSGSPWCLEFLITLRSTTTGTSDWSVYLGNESASRLAFVCGVSPISTTPGKRIYSNFFGSSTNQGLSGTFILNKQYRIRLMRNAGSGLYVFVNDEMTTLATHSGQCGNNGDKFTFNSNVSLELDEVRFSTVAPYAVPTVNSTPYDSFPNDRNILFQADSVDGATSLDNYVQGSAFKTLDSDAAATHSTAQAKYGCSSYKKTSEIKCARGSWAPVAGEEWTLEFDMYCSSNPTSDRMAFLFYNSSFADAFPRILFVITTGGQLYHNIYGSANVNYGGSTAFGANGVWSNIIIMRKTNTSDGGTVYAYLNRTLVASNAANGAMGQSGGGVLLSVSGETTFLDNIRISNYAVFGGVGPEIPWDRPLPNIPAPSYPTFTLAPL